MTTQVMLVVGLTFTINAKLERVAYLTVKM